MPLLISEADQKLQDSDACQRRVGEINPGDVFLSKRLTFQVEVQINRGKIAGD